jgi:hypothetical protein
LGYTLQEPIVVPKGTRIVTIVHFDNSPNNKFNPDAQKTVFWGLQNWDEMQSSFLGFLIPAEADVRRMLRASGASLQPRPVSGAGPTLSMTELPK